jgi:enhancing lycopene biosynthesis protein 2
MTKIAVILSGCGVYDGAEIHESVLTLLAIEKAGAKYRCFAPNIEQHHVVNHLTGEVSDESRNVLVEAARIARGDIEDLSELYVDEFDALIVPGGFGAAKNLSDFAINGTECQVNESVLKATKAFAQAKKPAGYMCIAPAMLPLIYGKGVIGTIGTDSGVAEQVSTIGMAHENCGVDAIVFDEENQLVSTPAYMLATNLVEAASGIDKLVTKVVELTNK